MKPVFEYFKFPVRIYNCWGYKFYSYDPEIRNKNIPAFFGLVKDNHIYTLNSNIVGLARKNIQMNFTCCASSNFIFNRNEKPLEYKVFNTIDDILPILRQCQKNKDEQLEFNLIHSENNLMQIFCDLKRVGYTPFITWKAGQIENLKMRFNSVLFNVRCQSLVADAVDSSIIVNNADVFNKMKKAMFEFNKSLFSPSHKSFYDKQDMQILRDYRSIVPHGVFLEI